MKTFPRNFTVPTGPEARPVRLPPLSKPPFLREFLGSFKGLGFGGFGGFGLEGFRGLGVWGFRGLRVWGFRGLGV